ncbi:recombinase family protein [Streptomyces sp. NPDC002677]|uniref:recombinase family protein n=1 Tax=Streptomyces sp. NPDC002677 TaxID=3154774 RepID=UPI00331C938F
MPARTPTGRWPVAVYACSVWTSTPSAGRSCPGSLPQRLAGHSVARITRALNDAGIPSPSAADPDRNPHPTSRRWILTTVRTILANPRYTGSPSADRHRSSTRKIIKEEVTSLPRRQNTRARPEAGGGCQSALPVKRGSGGQ